MIQNVLRLEQPEKGRSLVLKTSLSSLSAMIEAVLRPPRGRSAHCETLGGSSQRSLTSSQSAKQRVTPSTQDTTHHYTHQ